MGAGEPEEAFRVSDRRRRPAGADEPSLPVAAAPKTGPASPEPPQRQPERSLVGLFMMLATSAAMSMGETPDPATGQRHQEMAAAADAIDVLVLLREKTEGHRSAAEGRILDELIYDLQLRYVNAMKRAGPPPGPPRP